MRSTPTNGLSYSMISPPGLGVTSPGIADEVPRTNPAAPSTSRRVAMQRPKGPAPSDVVEGSKAYYGPDDVASLATRIGELAQRDAAAAATAGFVERLRSAITRRPTHRMTVPLSSAEGAALLASTRALSRIDGILIHYDDNANNRDTPRTDRRAAFVSAAWLLDERGSRSEQDGPAAIWKVAAHGGFEQMAATRFLPADTSTRLLGIELVRDAHRGRLAFERLPEAGTPQTLAEGTPVAVYFRDKFADDRPLDRVPARRRGSIGEYANGQILQLGGENYVALDDGRVLRLNRYVLEVRLRPGAASRRRDEVVDEAFAAYGRTWGHNDNNGRGGVVHRFKAGESVPSHVLNELSRLIGQQNPYVLSGLLVRYVDHAKGREALASVAIGELAPSMIGAAGLALPGLPIIPYTDVTGLVGRGGDGYGAKMASLDV